MIPHPAHEGIHLNEETKKMSETVILAVRPEAGDKVSLDDYRQPKWSVRAASRNFSVCVQQVPFKPKGTLRYTVLDWRNGVRGPCNLIGQGYGDGTYSAAECGAMLGEFESGELEVSHRNQLPLFWLATHRPVTP